MSFWPQTFCLCSVADCLDIVSFFVNSSNPGLLRKLCFGSYYLSSSIFHKIARKLPINVHVLVSILFWRGKKWSSSFKICLMYAAIQPIKRSPGCGLRRTRSLSVFSLNACAAFNSSLLKTKSSFYV